MLQTQRSGQPICKHQRIFSDTNSHGRRTKPETKYPILTKESVGLLRINDFLTCQFWQQSFTQLPSHTKRSIRGHLHITYPHGIEVTSLTWNTRITNR